MRVLVIHNSYQYSGGEDSVVESEVALLRSRGNEVATYIRDNKEIAAMSATAVAVQALWSSRSANELTALIHAFRPDIIHVHNTLPLISPSIYWVAAHNCVPVVQTLHNYRLMCLNALYLRGDRICEDCAGHVPWRGVVRKCYRGSGSASAVLAGILTVHRLMGTYREKVSRYIALNNFCRTKFIEGGLPADRIIVKPNFTAAPELRDLPRSGVLFVGRLSVEKGVESLKIAATLLPNVQLRVVGDGLQESMLKGVKGVTCLGRLSRDAVLQEMSKSIAVVVPSIWYETFGMVVIEAFSSGTPVIASRIGVLAELVKNGETGLLFEAGNPHDLAKKIDWALANQQEMAAMGHRAREKFEAEFSAEVNYDQLLEIYNAAVNG